MTNPYANKGTHYSMFGRDYTVSLSPAVQTKINELCKNAGGTYESKEYLKDTWKELSADDKLYGVDGLFRHSSGFTKNVQARYQYRKTWVNNGFRIRITHQELVMSKADILITLYLADTQEDVAANGTVSPVIYWSVVKMDKLREWLNTNEAARATYGKANQKNDRNKGGEIHYTIPLVDIHPPYILGCFVMGMTIDGVWRAREDHTIIPLCDLI